MRPDTASRFSLESGAPDVENVPWAPTHWLKGHHRLDSVRAYLLEPAGDYPGAIEDYRTAANRTTSLPERNYLMTQAAKLRESPAAAAEKTG